MKCVLIAASVLAVSVVSASAQSASYPAYNPAVHKYLERRHPVCQTKAQRLVDYERGAAKGARLSSAEERTVRRLKVDLDRGCGGFRLSGRR